MHGVEYLNRAYKETVSGKRRVTMKVFEAEVERDFSDFFGEHTSVLLYLQCSIH